MPVLSELLQTLDPIHLLEAILCGVQDPAGVIGRVYHGVYILGDGVVSKTLDGLKV